MRMGYALLWFVFFQILGFFAYPIVAAACPGLRDRGYGISKALGFLLFGYLCWIVPATGLYPFTALWCWISISILFVGALIALHGGPGVWLRYYVHGWRDIYCVEALHLGVFTVFLVIRAFSPEIFWGEKPMDFTFLNYFVRLENFPIEDPWAAGQAMRYYYFGSYFFAAVTKVLHVPTSYGYNLAFASLPAMLAGATYTVVRQIAHRRKAALIGAVLILVLSNLEGTRLMLFDNRAPNFDMYWATTRILKHAMATEYPIWSFLFADLHAHVIALPFTVLVVALTLAFLTPRGNPALHIVLFGVSLGTLMGVNFWDYLNYVLFAVLVWITAFRLEKQRLVPLLGIPAGGVVSLVALIPFVLTLVGGKGDYGIQRSDFHPFEQYFRVLGHFLIPLFIVAVPVARRGFHRPSPLERGSERTWYLAGVLTIGSLPLFLPALLSLPEPPWGILLTSSLLFGLGLALVLRPHPRPGHLGAGALILGIVCFTVIPEVSWLADRMNTLFKLYYAAWMLSALALGGWLPQLGVFMKKAFAISLQGRHVELAIGWRPGALVAGLAILIAVVGGLIHIGVITTFQRVAGPRPTLDGTAYFARHSIHDKKLTDWIQANVHGLPRLLEAHGDSYGSFTRVSMHTGLPTWLGWEHHVKQRGTASEEVDSRKELIRRMYATEDAAEAHDLLKQFKIDLVVVGDIERKRYGNTGTSKFEKHPRYFEKIFETGPQTLYRVIP